MVNQVTGFYGKLPSHGDFLSRRLPRQFIEPWDRWLQDGVAASQEKLGKNWLNTFLVSPIWEFALSPGLCGEHAWAGVVMPSVDKVGRYFPLTLAAKVDHGRLASLFEPDCGWFDALSQLALSTLEYGFDLKAFDEGLERLNVADFLSAEDMPVRPGVFSGSGRMAFQFVLNSAQDTPQAFAELGNQLCGQFLAGCSYWRSLESDTAKAALLLCEGLPPADAYIGFLNGKWPQRGWSFSSTYLSDVRQPSIASRMDENPADLTPAAIAASDPVSQPSDAEEQEKTNPRAIQPTSAPSESKAPEWESCAISVVGLRRKLNEDAILDRNEAGLWAVADGMGGHSAGDVASQALVQALAQVSPVDDLEHYSEQVASCLHGVNRDLLQLAESRGYGQIIGSTIVVLLIVRNEFRYLWAGDSRLYRYRQGNLEQLSADHSLYNESVSLGLSPLDGSLDQGRGNVITRAVGADTQLRLDCGQGQVEDQDVFILCSDGIDKELSHAEIAALCATGSAEEVAHKLVEQAETRGGRDNISVIVVRALSGKPMI
ncbi:MAG: type VI secretion system-associated protein TagF [Methylomonas sp.]